MARTTIVQGFRGYEGSGYDRGAVLFDARVSVARHTAQKNDKRIYRAGNRSFIGKGSKTKALTDELTARLLQLRRGIPSIDYPVSLEIEVVTPMLTKKKERNKKLIDLDNAIQGPIDSLVKAGILEDDRWIDRLFVRRIDGENSLRIIIQALEE